MQHRDLVGAARDQWQDHELGQPGSPARLERAGLGGARGGLEDRELVPVPRGGVDRRDPQADGQGGEGDQAGDLPAALRARSRTGSGTRHGD